jgi:hypothetical protein
MNNNKCNFLLFLCSAQSHFALLHSTRLTLSDTGRNTGAIYRKTANEGERDASHPGARESIERAT